MSTKKAVITGGSGNLGAYAVEAMLAAGYDVLNLDIARPRDPICPTWVCDLTRSGDLYEAFADAAVVIHLAARVGGIGANRRRPAEFFYDNLMMSAQLFHECWKAGVEKFTGVGTVCSYPKFARVPFVEDDLWGGYPEETNAPYGLAKKMLMVQSQAYREQYGTRLAMYGGIDKHVIRRTQAEIVAELEYKLPPMIASGGCVLALDHRIPNGTPLKNYRFYVDKVWEILERES